MYKFDLKTQNQLHTAYVLQEKIRKIRKMICCKIRNSRPLNDIDLANIEKYCIVF